MILFCVAVKALYMGIYLLSHEVGFLKIELQTALYSPMYRTVPNINLVND